MNNAYMGSSFDDFLQEEGIAIEVKNEAIKSLISYNLFKEMQEQKEPESASANQTEFGKIEITP